MKNDVSVLQVFFCVPRNSWDEALWGLTSFPYVTHTFILLSLLWVGQSRDQRRWFLYNQYCGLQWKGNVWGKGLERNGRRHVRSGRRPTWPSCSFCAQKGAPSTATTRKELDQTLSFPNPGWGLVGNREPWEALPVHSSAPLSFGRHGVSLLDQQYLSSFFLTGGPTTLPTAYHISVGLKNLLILIAHSCDL